MSDLKHLLESVQAIAQGPDDARIAHLRMDRWIDYPRAAYALGTLEELLRTPPRARMPCVLVHGASGMGKTMLIDKFMRSHRPQYDRAKVSRRRRSLRCRCPPRPASDGST